MKEGERQFKVPLVQEVFSEENGKIIDRITKTVDIYAMSFCEAIVKAVNGNRGFTFDRSANRT